MLTSGTPSEDAVRAVASIFRHMVTAVVDKDSADFDATYKETLNYISFISKDKVYRHGGEVSHWSRQDNIKQGNVY